MILIFLDDLLQLLHGLRVQDDLALLGAPGEVLRLHVVALLALADLPDVKVHRDAVALEGQPLVLPAARREGEVDPSLESEVETDDSRPRG